MKKLALLFMLFALTLGVSAQNNLINFGDLPGVGIPTPVPTTYENYNWGGIYYVNPWLWPGAGPGFKHQEFVRNASVRLHRFPDRIHAAGCARGCRLSHYGDGA